MTNPSTAARAMPQRKSHTSWSRLALGALAVLAFGVGTGRQPVHASAPQHQAGASGRVTVHFTLSHGKGGAATWFDAFRVVKAPAQQFSGCAIETDHVLHSRQLVVHVWPRTTSEFLTRDFKLTVSLTSSGAVSSFPVPPTVAVGFRGTLYSIVSSSSASRATVRHGGQAGTFDIRNVFDSSTSKGGLRVTGSWSCTGMMHFTS